MILQCYNHKNTFTLLCKQAKVYQPARYMQSDLQVKPVIHENVKHENSNSNSKHVTFNTQENREHVFDNNEPPSTSSGPQISNNYGINAEPQFTTSPPSQQVLLDAEIRVNNYPHNLNKSRRPLNEEDDIQEDPSAQRYGEGAEEFARRIQGSNNPMGPANFQDGHKTFKAFHNILDKLCLKPDAKKNYLDDEARRIKAANNSVAELYEQAKLHPQEVIDAHTLDHPAVANADLTLKTFVAGL